MEKTRFDKVAYTSKSFKIDVFLGADISDYFNYGFTEETWAQYCDRQRRLRAENNLARLNAAHVEFKTIFLNSFD
jgi:hypothetical protein